MVLSYLLLGLSALSLVALGICAWCGMKAGRAEDADVEVVNHWMNRVMVCSICLIVFGVAYQILSHLGGFAL